MQVLSNEEIKSIYYNEPGDYYDLARAIEAAVLERFEIAGFEPAEPYEIEPALVLELIERLEAAEKRLAYRDEECVIITKKQLRVWLDDRDDGSIDWRGENEV